MSNTHINTSPSLIPRPSTPTPTSTIITSAPIRRPSPVPKTSKFQEAFSISPILPAALFTIMETSPQPSPLAPSFHPSPVPSYTSSSPSFSEFPSGPTPQQKKRQGSVFESAPLELVTSDWEREVDDSFPEFLNAFAKPRASSTFSRLDEALVSGEQAVARRQYSVASKKSKMMACWRQVRSLFKGNE